MLARWPIRRKLFFGAGLLLAIIVVMSGSGLYGLYAYRSLIKSLERVTELRTAGELARAVSDLRAAVGELKKNPGRPATPLETQPGAEARAARDAFQTCLQAVGDRAARYREQLEFHGRRSAHLHDRSREFATIRQIETGLARVASTVRHSDWMFDEVRVGQLQTETERLQELASNLPHHLHQNIRDFTEGVRGCYRTFIGLGWTAAGLTLLLLALLVRLVYRGVFQPLLSLADGSRRIAGGQFDYRIAIDDRDEMSELASALNKLTERFLAVRDELNLLVQERTRQIIRSQRLANVGVLAAGVSHEINNPLASIAMSAESLEMRWCEADGGWDASQRQLARDYVEMIRREATRCRQITSRLLDFSRMGHAACENTDLVTLVRQVVAVAGHLPQHRGKRVEVVAPAALPACVKPGEIEQVVLNLLANALEAVEADGRVQIEVREAAGEALLVVRDNGCGLSDEVRQKLFEPFFTRRKSGQGTGLGLTIAERIVRDHGGQIEAESQGPGQGSTFRVRLPLRLSTAPAEIRKTPVAAARDLTLG